MTSTTRLLPFLAAAVAVPLLLTGCGGAAPDPTTPDPSGPSEPAGPSGPSAGDLDYPIWYEESMLDSWAADREQIVADTDAWNADCTPEQAGDPADACTPALHELLRSVNGLKQRWLAFDNGDWDGGEYSGLVALKPTRDATLVASTSGSDWSGTCIYVAGNPECTGLATTFLADLDALNTAFASWIR